MTTQFGKVLPTHRGGWTLPRLDILNTIRDAFRPKPQLPKTLEQRLDDYCQREADAIDALFADRNLRGVYIDALTASPIAGYVRYHVCKPNGVPVNKITGLRDDIAALLTNMRPDDDDVTVTIRLPRLIIEVEYPFEQEVLGWDIAPLDRLKSGEMIVGRNYESKVAKPVVENLHSKETTNFLIAALPGSGKSQAIVQMVISAAHSTDPEDIKFIVLDPKYSAELYEIGQLAHCEFYSDVDECVQQIFNLRAEIEKRKTTRDKRTIVLVIDELSEFCDKSNKESDLMSALRSIARLGRSFGVKVIAATQYPTVEATDSELRTMLDSRLGGHVGSETQSRVCMDVPSIGCEHLPKRGAFFYKDGNSRIRRINTHYLPDYEIHEVVDGINTKWQGKETFSLAVGERPIAVAESNVNADTVTDAQIEAILDAYDIDELIRDDGKGGYKLHHGKGSQLIKFVFGDDAKTNDGTYRRWVAKVPSILADEL